MFVPCDAVCLFWISPLHYTPSPTPYSPRITGQDWDGGVEVETKTQKNKQTVTHLDDKYLSVWHHEGTIYFRYLLVRQALVPLRNPGGSFFLGKCRCMIKPVRIVPILAEAKGRGETITPVDCSVSGC